MRKSVGQPTPPYAEDLSQVGLGELEEGSFVFYSDTNGVKGSNGSNILMGSGTVASGSYSHTTGMGNITLPTPSDPTPSAIPYMNSSNWGTPGVHTLEVDKSSSSINALDVAKSYMNISESKSSSGSVSNLMKNYMNTQPKKSKTFSASMG